MNDIAQLKKENSLLRIDEFKKKLCQIDELKELENLSVFVSGSYAREEASEYSDIDLFFVLEGDLNELELPNIKSMRAFSKIIEASDSLGFPTFSNDGEFLKILEKKRILEELGGKNDDHLNFFTARMLMLLESKPVYGSISYNRVLMEIIEAYFRDYKHHPENFNPTFLVNDILRFWKTLCLNYEHKRNKRDDKKAIKQKIKNLKLKFSRMLTCFGSIVAIIDHEKNVEPGVLIDLAAKTPRARLTDVVGRYPCLKHHMDTINTEYSWFLQLTNIPEDELIEAFKDQGVKSDAFKRADKFGSAMFNIVKYIAEERGYLRYLLI